MEVNTSTEAEKHTRQQATAPVSSFRTAPADIGSPATTGTVSGSLSAMRRKSTKASISAYSSSELSEPRRLCTSGDWRNPVSAHVGRSHIVHTCRQR